MLSEPTIAQLSALTYQAEAKRGICWLPLGGIYWADELPSGRLFSDIAEGDRKHVLRMFALRARIWRGQDLSERDRKFWTTLRSDVPSWAFFQRLKLSPDDQRAQDEAEHSSAEAFEALLADADEVNITEEDGVQSFSASFDLTKQPLSERKEPWWVRIARRWFP